MSGTSGSIADSKWHSVAISHVICWNCGLWVLQKYPREKEHVGPISVTSACVAVIASNKGEVLHLKEAKTPLESA